MIIPILLEHGQFYHIYNRGTDRKPIFFEDADYHYFLNLLLKYVVPVADIYSYCLMKNHFHFLVRIKEEDKLDNLKKPISQVFSNFFNAYAKTFNNKYTRTGKLFEERFKRKNVVSDNYFTEIIYYIHANPQRHQIVTDFRDYSYSSYPIMLSNEKTFLKREEVLEWFGGSETFEGFHLERNKYLIGE